MPATPFATEIVKKLTEAGFIAYFAGGWVRDFLMQRACDDIDIATSAPVEAVQRLFPKTIPVGISFGIVIVVYHHYHFEVATFRKDRGYVDGRRPIGIELAEPEEDAKRRDFTINGMFYDPLKKQLLDFVGGQKDLDLKIIQAIGDPHERFLEDRLRMMRAVRYATRFDFQIEPRTFQAIREHAANLFPSVAIERIWQEFKKMSQFAHFDEGLISLHRLGLLETIFPALKNCSSNEIAKRVAHISQFPKQTPTIIELLELFPHFSLQEILSLCAYLKLSNEDKELAAFWHHSKTLLGMPADWQAKLELIEWAHFYADKHAPLCLEIFVARLPESEKKSLLEVHQNRIHHLKHPIERIQKQMPLVGSQDLMDAGIKPGKQMGILLKEAERIAANEAIEDREIVLTRLKKNPLWKGT